MRDVYIIGVDMMKFGKHLDRSIKSMTAEVVTGVLEDAGVAKDRIEAAWFSNSGWGRRSGQDAIRGEVALRPLGIDRIPITNVENACASASTALNAACMAVAGGFFDLVLTVGAEKIFHPDKMQVFAGYLAGMDVEDIGGTLRFFEQLEALVGIRSDQWPEQALPPGKVAGTDGEEGADRPRRQGLPRSARSLPGRVRQRVLSTATLAKNAVILGNLFGADNFKVLVRSGLARSRSPFMDLYSLAARAHMDRFGTTQRQLAIIASKNHAHSTLNPRAQYTRAISVEEVLADTRVSYPLTRAMCAPIGDGAAAAILCSRAYLKKLTCPRPVKVRASVLGSGRDRGIDDEDIAARLGRQAYEAAGFGPEAVDLAELHDASAFGELHHTETLGFCGEGEGGRLAETGATRLGGRLPVNTSGGLESRGHPVGATGLAQIHELVTQLRGQAGRRQVPGARVALAQNGGGNIGIEEAAMAIHILEGPAASAP